MTKENQVTEENLSVTLLDLETHGEYELVSMPNCLLNRLKSCEFPVYIGINESHPNSVSQMAVGLTVEQTEELIQNLQNILQQVNE